MSKGAVQLLLHYRALSSYSHTIFLLLCHSIHNQRSIVMGEHDAISADYFLTLTPEAEGRLRPPPQEEPLRCPRCNSTSTKFCYYNNYSLSQPRYFCRSCRRYWTKGGSLRNVPVGGGCRRNKRYRPDSAAVSATATVHHRPQPALLPGDRKPALLPSYLTNNGSLNIMNNCKLGLGEMNTLGHCMDGSRETLMEEPCQNLKFFFDGEGSWNNILSIGWQESIGCSDDHHGSLSSSWARI